MSPHIHRPRAQAASARQGCPQAVPSAVLHIQVQILSPRLRFSGRQTHCAGSGFGDVQVGHLLPALFTIRRGKESSVLVFLGRLLEVFRDRGGKKPTKPKQKFIRASHRQGTSGEVPSSWGFSLPPLMQIGGQNLSGLLWKTHAQTYTHTLSW